MSLPSFRQIRPSTVGGSSTSTSNPSHSTTESTSTGSESRRQRGEKDIEHSSSSSKRRRAPESLTRNACLNCKKARAKCDGKQPCRRCTTRTEGVECIYEIHIKHAKEELVKQIKELRAKDHVSEQILQALSTGEKVPEILERLKNGHRYASIVEWLGRSAADDPETMSPRGSQLSTFDTSDHEMGSVSPSVTGFGWSTVSSEKPVFDHLLQLYFAWVHPVYTLFSEGRFVDCYNRQSDDYCSSLLVNAICAMACLIHPVGENDETDFGQLGHEFAEAVGKEIDSSDKAITTTQTLAVMFLLHTARANALRATSYLKLATRNLASVAYQDSEGFPKVVSYTTRGIRNLNIEWAQLTFQIPPAFFPPRYDGREGVDDESDDVPWFFYQSTDKETTRWRGLLSTTNREKSKLLEIVQDVTDMMYNPQAPKISAYLVLQQFDRLVAWREGLPSSIAEINHGSRALPHVLSLLILYSSSIVQLLRPLLEIQNFTSCELEEVIWHHAQEGLMLMDEHYRATYGCRFQPVLQMFAVLHLADVIARFFPGGTEGLSNSKDGPEAIQFAMESLMQSREAFPVAAPLQEMLRRTANECAIRLPNNIGELMMNTSPQPPKYRMDDLIAACTRPTYTQPIEQITLRYLPTFSSDWPVQAKTFGFPEPSTGTRRLWASAEERGAQSLMHISNLLNTG